MKFVEFFAIVIICLVVTIVFGSISTKNIMTEYKVVNYNEMQKWFCVDHNRHEFYRLHDRLVMYNDFQSIYPKDKRFEFERVKTIEYMEQAEERMRNPKDCTSKGDFDYFDWHKRNVEE